MVFMPVIVNRGGGGRGCAIGEEEGNRGQLLGPIGASKRATIRLFLHMHIVFFSFSVLVQGALHAV